MKKVGKMMDVSVIIVNYNTKELIKNCLKSIYEKTKDINFEIIVSDNASTDGSQEMIKQEFPNVILIENNQNLGFGAANNKGLKIAKGKYIFYLNSDTLLLNNALKYFFDYWENSYDKENIGCLGSMLLNPDESFSNSYHVFPNSKSCLNFLIRVTASSFHLKKIIKTKPKNKSAFYGLVDFVVGADMFLKNDEKAYFDERFFLYYEETDLQFQLMKKNKKRIIIEGPRIVHLEGASSKEGKTVYSFKKASSAYYWESCLKYIKKNEKVDFYYFLIKCFCNIIMLLPWNIKSRKYFMQRLHS